MSFKILFSPSIPPPHTGGAHESSFIFIALPRPILGAGRDAAASVTRTASIANRGPSVFHHLVR